MVVQHQPLPSHPFGHDVLEEKSSCCNVRRKASIQKHVENAQNFRKHHYLPGIFTYKVSLGIHTPRHESSS